MRIAVKAFIVLVVLYSTLILMLNPRLHGSAKNFAAMINVLIIAGVLWL
jgi:hypothetical protein